MRARPRARRRATRASASSTASTRSTSPAFVGGGAEKALAELREGASSSSRRDAPARPAPGAATGGRRRVPVGRPRRDEARGLRGRARRTTRRRSQINPTTAGCATRSCPSVEKAGLAAASREVVIVISAARVRASRSRSPCSPRVGGAARARAAVRPSPAWSSTRAAKPVEYANVSMRRTRAAARSTDADGRFALELPGRPCVLEVSQLGYRKRVARGRRRGGHGAAAHRRSPRSRCRSPRSWSPPRRSARRGKSEGAVLAAWTSTPRRAARPTCSSRCARCPGINAPNEGAALFVRGGDPQRDADPPRRRRDRTSLSLRGRLGRAVLGVRHLHAEERVLLERRLLREVRRRALGRARHRDRRTRWTCAPSRVGANLVGGGVSTSWALVPEKLSVRRHRAPQPPSLLFEPLRLAERTFEVCRRSERRRGEAALSLLAHRRELAVYLGSRGDRVGRDRRRAQRSLGLRRAKPRNHFVGAPVPATLIGEHARAPAARPRRSATARAGRFGLDGVRRRAQRARATSTRVWPPRTATSSSFGANWRGRHARIPGRVAGRQHRLRRRARRRATSPRDARRSTSRASTSRTSCASWGRSTPRSAHASTAPRTRHVDARSARRAGLAASTTHQTVRLAAGRYHQLARRRVPRSGLRQPRARAARAPTT